MQSCRACQSELPVASKFCLACGSAVDADATIALAAAAPAVVTRHPLSGGNRPRFAPGEMLAGRYQIIGLLGKGGMGEVYRANDLTLDQPVALKFLPPSVADDPAMLARFHGEVRVARQVSHPNVCRVYDIGVADGLMFLSMEYVDGEDLGCLLRRIGRLPTDKAIEITRKLCAGLAAAHEKGVIHRDLKPANIMLDSEGHVVIMDFGLAGVAEQMVGAEIRAGTPGYMAPEQLAGREVTVRSDIYSLMMQLQEHSLPPSLLTVVKDLDPAVERVIHRCLSPDPSNRPASALAVAAALPGGDPLAAALAAGETPSPLVVAASGSTAGTRPAVALGIAAFIAVCMLAILVLAPMVQYTGIAPLPLPPEVLTHKAREYAAAFGYSHRPADQAGEFSYDHDALLYIERQTPAAARWDAIARARPGAVQFWYRQSPRTLEPVGRIVTEEDPPQNVSGMLHMTLAPDGRLLDFSAVPPQLDDSRTGVTSVDWNPLLSAAGFQAANLTAADPRWIPPVMADARMAWATGMPGAPQTKLRLEAAAWHGKPVYFAVVGPWTRAARVDAFQPSRRIMQLCELLLAIAVLIGAALLSRHNVKRSHGDIQGATRLSAFAGAVFFAIWLLHGTHKPTAWEIGALFHEIALTLLVAASVWVGYVAVEPFVRRHWPQAIVSWTRLLAGGWRDPLVGRDLLIGVAAGCFWTLVSAGSTLIERHLGAMPNLPFLFPLLSTRATLAAALAAFANTLIQLLVAFFVLFVVRALLRKEWLSAAAFILFFTVLTSAGTSTPWVDAAFAVPTGITVYLIITRAGFVAFLAALYVQYFFAFLPLTSDFSSWYAGGTIFALLIVGGLAVFGAHSALAGRSILKDELL